MDADPVAEPPRRPKGVSPPPWAVPMPVPDATPPLKELDEEKPDAETPPKPTWPVPPAFATPAKRDINNYGDAHDKKKNF